jgi:hypothetical protein
MSAKPYFSPAQLDLYLNCGEAYRRRYIERQIIPPGIALIRGSAVHAPAEVNHKQKRDSGVDLSEAELTAIAASAFDEKVKREGVELTREEKGIGAQKAIGQGKDGAVRLTKLYSKAVAPDIQPDLVEERVRIELPDSPMDMVGVIDVTTKEKDIVDLKTSSKSKSKSEAETSLQLSWYAMAYRALTGTDPRSVRLEVLVDTATPKHQRLETTRTRRDYEVLVNRVNTAMGGIKAGVFVPANAGHWLCSRKWCGFAPTCPYYNAERDGEEE